MKWSVDGYVAKLPNRRAVYSKRNGPLPPVHVVVSTVILQFLIYYLFYVIV